MIVGLTGGIATGKSTVAEILVRLGAFLIDADRIGHELLKSGSPVFAEVVRAFGEDILLPDGNIDRKALGRIVFSDYREKKKLEAIVHPAIMQEIKKRIDDLPEGSFIVLEAALLVETNMHHMTDYLWLTWCPRTVQLARIQERDDLTEKEALQRIKAQMPVERKIPLADQVIHTDRSREELEDEVAFLYRKYISGEVSPADN